MRGAGRLFLTRALVVMAVSIRGHACAFGAAPAKARETGRSAGDGCTEVRDGAEPGAFRLLGVVNPAMVYGNVLLYASGLPPGSVVTYLVDGRQVRKETQAPFWLGGERDGTPLGYSVIALQPGDHSVSATASSPGGHVVRSTSLALEVISAASQTFSPKLSAYAGQPQAATSSVAEMLARSSTPGAQLGAAEIKARCDVLAMYKNWGIDPTLDHEEDNSGVLKALLPKQWSPERRGSAHDPVSLQMSRDAAAYQPIPKIWPRVVLPSGYIQHVQLSTPEGGDGIGYGEAVARADDPTLPIVSQWYAEQATRRSFLFPMPRDWDRALPTQVQGDRHMVFVDPRSDTFVSAYKASLDEETRGVKALYASAPTPLRSLGDRGGSNASGIAELPLLVQPGEAIDPEQPIRHALGGAVNRVWAARVYPATAWDAHVRTSENSCTHLGFTNTGLVPYGGVIQLDPALDLAALHVSLPARRLLEAMQTYGYYVLDFGCADLDIYTAAPASDFEPYGGLWGFNRKGPGVQREVEEVIARHRFYVVAPMLKKQ